MAEAIEWDYEKDTWNDHLHHYPLPKGKTFPKDYELPDGLVVSDWYYGGYSKRKGKKNRGVTLQILSERLFARFPEAPREGPARGLLWFSKDELGRLCALEERENFHLFGFIG